jgi:phosphate-selective porin OprO/OprP
MRPQPVYASALFALLLMSPASAVAQSNQQDEDRSGVHWRNRPSFQIGDIRLDVRFKLAYDWRRYDPEIGEEDSLWRVRRGGINGEIGDHVDFQIERDLYSDGEWRDVFVNWRTFRQFEFSAGRFKVPFGFEQLISTTSVDFAFRSLASQTIPPARDEGVMAHGRFFQRGLTYEVGVFEADGDNGVLREEQFSPAGDVDDIGPSFAARVTALPLREIADVFERFRAAFAFGRASLPEGLNSLRGETVYGTTEFFEPVYVKGRRTRMGVELNYNPGPVGLSAEWMQAREQRKNQGLGDVDLSDLITTGWYTSATWLLTGEDKNDFDTPRAPLFQGGIGALELGVRYERLGFESAEKVGPAFANPRAEHILGNSDRVWTFGVNWFANRWVRTTVNAIREQLEDPSRAPNVGTDVYWSGVGRVQLVF